MFVNDVKVKFKNGWLEYVGWSSVGLVKCVNYCVG